MNLKPLDSAAMPDDASVHASGLSGIRDLWHSQHSRLTHVCVVQMILEYHSTNCEMTLHSYRLQGRHLRNV